MNYWWYTLTKLVDTARVAAGIRDDYLGTKKIA
jgi:hypothetical protein